MLQPWSLLFLVALLVTPRVAFGQTNWIERQPQHRPAARAWHALVYDEARARHVLYGGRGAGQASLNDTWEWLGGDWAQVTTPTSPPPSSAIGMCFDSARDLAILVLADGALWEFNGIDWVSRGVAPGNPMQAGGRLLVAYDSLRARTVVVRSANVVDEWDGQVWATVQSPLSVETWGGETNLTFDVAHGVATFYVTYKVLGFSPLVVVGWKTWGWDGASWTPTDVLAQAYLTGGAMCYRSAGGHLFLYGGTDFFGSYSATASLYVSGSSVSSFTTSKNPKGRHGHAMSDDNSTGRVLLFGGWSQRASFLPQVLSDETFEYVGVPLDAFVESYGMGCGVQVPELAPHPAVRPVMGAVFGCDLTAPGAWAGGLIVGFQDEGMALGPAFPELPIDLSAVGMTGCTLYVGPALVTDPTLVTSGPMSFSFGIPADSAVFGAQIYLQGYSLDALANPLGLVLSNALQLTVGDV